jgi:hypothetical protein
MGSATQCVSYAFVSQIPQATLSQCNYTEALWNAISISHNLPSFNAFSALEGPVECVRTLTRPGSKKEKRRRLGILLFWWHVWKERNKMVFEIKEYSVPQLAGLLQYDIAVFFRSRTDDRLPVLALFPASVVPCFLSASTDPLWAPAVSFCYFVILLCNSTIFY